MPRRDPAALGLLRRGTRPTVTFEPKTGEQRARRQTCPFPAPPLSDSVVALRPWRTTEPDSLMQYSDPLILNFSRTRSAAYTGADAREYFRAQEPTGTWAAAGRTGGLRARRPCRRPLCGRLLANPAGQRSRLRDARRLVAGWAFGELGIALVELTCGSDNCASQIVAARCGFTREGLLRSHISFKDGWRDTVLFSLVPGGFR